MPSDPKQLTGTGAEGSLSRESFLRVFSGRTITAAQSTPALFGQLAASAPFSAPQNIRAAFRVNPPVVVITEVLGVVPTVVVGTPIEFEPPDDPPPPPPDDTYVLLLLDQNGSTIELPVDDNTGALTVQDPDGSDVVIQPTEPPPDGVFLVQDVDGTQIIITFSLKQ